MSVGKSFKQARKQHFYETLAKEKLALQSKYEDAFKKGNEKNQALQTENIKMKQLLDAANLNIKKLKDRNIFQRIIQKFENDI